MRAAPAWGRPLGNHGGFGDDPVGVGAAGTAIAGMILFGETASAGKFLSLALIVGGIVGLKLTAA